MKRKIPKHIRYIVGIDEAGRGPLAGPVAVGAFKISLEKYTNKKIKKIFSGARDSKKMTVQAREDMFSIMKSAQRQGHTRYVVVMESCKQIDAKGIAVCIRKAVGKCLKRLNINPAETLVLLDGSLKAPVQFMYQETIIRGDDKELVISLASIVAKVARDTHMKKLSKKFPLYGFDIHKGYGTKFHREKIIRHGPSSEHRRTFLNNLTVLKNQVS